MILNDQIEVQVKRIGIHLESFLSYATSKCLRFEATKKPTTSYGG
jgi:hypothetical protein